jgi:hypothetical protein
VANPTTYASAKQVIGLAVETTQGTPITPAVTVPVDKFDPFDQPTWIDDKALRGSMTEPYVRVQGVNHSEFDIAGPAYFDTLPYLLSNIFGDVVYSGTYTGSGTTTSTATTAVGDTTINVHATTGTVLVQIDTGNLAEVRLITSVTGGSDPFTLHFATPLVYAHSSAAVVKPITFPYSSQFSVLNSTNGQPSTLTITDYQGPTTSTGTRAYAGCCLSELNIKGTVESSAIEYDGKGMGWPSASAAAFTSAPSSITPQAAWEAQVGLTGTVSGAPILTVTDFELNIKRELQPYYTAQNSQNPYTIFRGKLTAAGKLTFVVNNETALTYLNSNTQPQLQIIVSNGLSSSSLLSLQIDILKAAYTTSKIDRGKAAVGYDVEFDAIANTTNAGGSGGFSPVAVTVQNAITPGTF